VTEPESNVELRTFNVELRSAAHPPGREGESAFEVGRSRLDVRRSSGILFPAR